MVLESVISLECILCAPLNKCYAFAICIARHLKEFKFECWKEAWKRFELGSLHCKLLRCPRTSTALVALRVTASMCEHLGSWFDSVLFHIRLFVSVCFVSPDLIHQGWKILFQRSVCAAGIVMQWVQLLPVIPASCMDSSWSPDCCPSGPALLMCLGRQPWWCKYLGPCPSFGRIGWDSWLLALAWPRPDCLGHLGSEPVVGGCLSPSVYPPIADILCFG